MESVKLWLFWSVGALAFVGVVGTGCSDSADPYLGGIDEICSVREDSDPEDVFYIQPSRECTVFVCTDGQPIDFEGYCSGKAECDDKSDEGPACSRWREGEDSGFGNTGF